MDYSKMFAPNPPSVLKLRDFRGIDQSLDENDLDPKFSRHAHNTSYSRGTIRYPGGVYTSTFSPAFGSGIAGQPESVQNIHIFYKRLTDGTTQSWLVAFCSEYGSSRTFGIWVRYLTLGSAHPYTWQRILDIPSSTLDNINALDGMEFSFVNYQNDTTGILIFTTGADVYKWDGAYTGSTANAATKLYYTDSTHHAPQGRLITIYKERVLIAGDKAHPDTLYWSNEKLPADWTVDEANPNDAGWAEMPTWDGDVITAIVPLFDEVLIFKRHSLRRLSGSSPDNYVISEVADVGTPHKFAVTKTRNTVQFMSPTGMKMFDGMNLSQLIPTGRVDAIDQDALTVASSPSPGTRVFSYRNKVVIVPSAYWDYYTDDHNGNTDPYKTVPEAVEYDLETGELSFRNDLIARYLPPNSSSFDSLNHIKPIKFALEYNSDLLCTGPNYNMPPPCGNFIFVYNDDQDRGYIGIDVDTPTMAVGSLHMFHAIPETDFGVAGKKKRVSKITVSGRGGTVRITPICDGVEKRSITLELPEVRSVVKPKIVTWIGRKIGLWIENVGGDKIEVTDIELEYTPQGV